MKENAGKIGGRSLVDFPVDEIAIHFGPIVRFSSRLMNYLHEVSLQGAVAHSEVMPSTLCNVTSWCHYSNISTDYIGLIEYKFPYQVDSNVLGFLREIAPNRLFHPVRDIASVSQRDAKISKKHTPDNSSKHVPLEESRAIAFCLLGSPRPNRPSYNCPIGCPLHLQKTCPEVNCMWDGSGKYFHNGPALCLQRCISSKFKRCPVNFGTDRNVKAENKCSGKPRRDPCHSTISGVNASSAREWRPTLPVGNLG